MATHSDYLADDSTLTVRGRGNDQLGDQEDHNRHMQDDQTEDNESDASSDTLDTCDLCNSQSENETTDRSRYSEPLLVPRLKETCLGDDELGGSYEDRILYLDQHEPNINHNREQMPPQEFSVSWGSLSHANFHYHLQNMHHPYSRGPIRSRARLIFFDTLPSSHRPKENIARLSRLPLSVSQLKSLLYHYHLPVAYISARDNLYGPDALTKLSTSSLGGAKSFLAYLVRFPGARRSNLTPIAVAISEGLGETYAVLEGLPIKQWRRVFSHRNQFRHRGKVNMNAIISLLISENTAQLLNAVKILGTGFVELEETAGGDSRKVDFNPVIRLPSEVKNYQHNGGAPPTEHASFASQRPIYPKISRKHIAFETLRFYDLPWEYDRDNPEYIIILRNMSEDETDLIFDHTRRIWEAKRDSLDSQARSQVRARSRLRGWKAAWRNALVREKEQSATSHDNNREELGTRVEMKDLAEREGASIRPSHGKADAAANTHSGLASLKIDDAKRRRQAPVQIKRQENAAVTLSQLRVQIVELESAVKFSLRVIDTFRKRAMREMESAEANQAGASLAAAAIEQLDNAMELSVTMMERLAGLEKRADSTSAYLFNVASHRAGELSMQMAEVSKDIATATKRDSWQMKSIAIVTLIFLPPTAMSTFFSMGLFNWQNAQSPSSRDVLNPYFWVYWAVTIPVTVLVILGWDLYTRYRSDTESIELIKRSWEGGDGVRMDVTGWQRDSLVAERLKMFELRAGTRILAFLNRHYLRSERVFRHLMTTAERERFTSTGRVDADYYREG